MTTPICDFVRSYAQSNALRLHMPGHKGCGPLGFERLDITEIDGADSLYEADGIIRESELNASSLFGAPTLYSTEGSSQCIRAMLYLALLYARLQGKKPRIAAGRNVHKTFLSAAALMDLDVLWLYPERPDSYLSCRPDPQSLNALLSDSSEAPVAVYLTSPDYLGNTADIRAIAEVCHRRNVLLLIDNAHGAYLKFLPESLHPIDLGADLCCDSAHKTLPVLTGGAYLHMADSLPPELLRSARGALSLFGSTSPSYLILQSLDAANRYLVDYPASLSGFLPEVQRLKRALQARGYSLNGDEPLKLTVAAKAYGYSGHDFAAELLRREMVCEFCDPDFVVLMLTPETGAEGVRRLENAMLSIEGRPAILNSSPAFSRPERVMSIREAAFSLSETLPIAQCEGRLLASPSVGCPPAVPIVVCGERIDAAAIRCFSYYGISHCSVVIE